MKTRKYKLGNIIRKAAAKYLAKNEAEHWGTCGKDKYSCSAVSLALEDTVLDSIDDYEIYSQAFDQFNNFAKKRFGVPVRSTTAFKKYEDKKSHSRFGGATETSQSIRYAMMQLMADVADEENVYITVKYE